MTYLILHLVTFVITVLGLSKINTSLLEFDFGSGRDLVALAFTLSYPTFLIVNAIMMRLARNRKVQMGSAI